jgi:nucleoid-associated protein YgaU
MDANEGKRAMKQRWLAALICTADAGVLVLLRPPFATVARRLASPHQWLVQAGPDAALADTAAVLLWLVAAWLGLGITATLLARLPGAVGRAGGWAGRRLLPAAVRKVVAGSVGLSVLLTPVAGTVSSTAATVTSAAVSSAVPAPLWPTTNPPASRSTRPDGPRPQPAPATRSVRVRPGDSLWLIAAHRLGPAADQNDIAAAWPRWYAANRDVIGDDPGLIRPGQLLAPPSTQPDGTGQ